VRVRVWALDIFESKEKALGMNLEKDYLLSFRLSTNSYSFWIILISTVEILYLTRKISQVTLVATTRLTLDCTDLNIIYRCLVDSVLQTRGWGWVQLPRQYCFDLANEYLSRTIINWKLILSKYWSLSFVNWIKITF
jgi:hypothetical protein